MTKEEVLKAVRNHTGDIRNIAATLEYEVVSLVQGYRPEIPGEIGALVGMMDHLKDVADEVKDILNEWPS